MNNIPSNILKDKIPSGRTRGFTLIELILYVSLLSMFLMILVLFLTAIFEAREKQQMMAEVDQQGVQIIQTISRILGDAVSINSPLSGQSASSISLQVPNTTDPTTFTVDNTDLLLTAGSNAPVFLNNDRIAVSAFTIFNITPPGKSGSIQIVMTLTSVPRPGNRTDFTYSQVFQTSLSIYRP